MTGLSGFLDRFVVLPMKEGTGYNIVTTAMIVVLLGLAAFLLLKSDFVRKKKPLSLLGDVAPYLVLGAAARSLEDACVYPCSWPAKILFITPGIWALVFLLFLGTSHFAPKRARLAGWLLAGANVAIVAARLKNLEGLMLVLGFFVLGFAAVTIIRQVLRMELPLATSLVLAAHVFDASSTLVAVKFYSYFEEHVVARAVMGIGGAPAFYLVKIAGMLLILVLSERAGFSERERAVLLAAILAVGLGPGLRNTMSLAMGA